MSAMFPACKAESEQLARLSGLKAKDLEEDFATGQNLTEYLL